MSPPLNKIALGAARAGIEPGVARDREVGMARVRGVSSHLAGGGVIDTAVLRAPPPPRRTVALVFVG